MSPVSGAMILMDKKNTNVLSDSKVFYKVRVKSGAQLISAFTIASGTDEAEIGGRTYINIISNGVKNIPPAKSPDQEEPAT